MVCEVVYECYDVVVLTFVDLRACVENEDDDGHDFHLDCRLVFEFTPECDFRSQCFTMRFVRYALGGF